MKTNTYRIPSSATPRLKALLATAEAEVAGLDDTELDEAEKVLADRIRLVSASSSRRAQVINLQARQKRQGVYTGAFAIVAAALCLLLVQQRPDDDRELFTVKGNAELAPLPCISHIVQADRSSPEPLESAYAIDTSIATHVEIICSEPVFAHVLALRDGRWEVLLQNQKLETGRGWLEEKGGLAAFDLTPAAASKIMLVASRKELGSEELPFSGPDAQKRAGAIWIETLSFEKK